MLYAAGARLTAFREISSFRFSSPDRTSSGTEILAGTRIANTFRVMRIRSDEGFSLIELLIVVAIIGIVAAMAVAGVMRAKIAANEVSAIASLRTITSAQQAFASSCANGFYASTLPILMSAPAAGTPFISPDLGSAATVIKSGYAITLAGASDGIPSIIDACNPLGVAASLVNSYYATANHLSWSSGSRYFWTNTPGTIFFDPANPIAHTSGTTPPSAPARPLESAP